MPARRAVQQLREVGAGREHGRVEVELRRALREPRADHGDGGRERPVDVVRLGHRHRRRIEREAGGDGGEQLVGRAVAQRPAVDAADRRELLAVARRAAHDPDQREVGEHEARRYVERRGGAFAPRADLLGDAARPVPRSWRAPFMRHHASVGLGPGAHAQAALFALVGCPLEPAHRFEPRDEHVLQREQVLDVGGRVEPLVDGQRAAGPVGEPVAFREPHVEEAFDERRRATARPSR